MNRRVRILGVVALAACCLLGRATVAVADMNPGVPSPEFVLTNVMARITSAQTNGFRGKYSYTRTKSKLELDDKGAVKEKDEQTYAVFPIAGHPFTKTLEVNGKPLSEKDRRKEEAFESATRQQRAAVAPPPYRAKKDIPLTMEILNRFDFKVAGKETLNGRTMWVLTFKPGAVELPVEKIQDRVVNKMGGTVWVDAEEFEIAKADVHLLQNVNLVGGIVGTLRRLDFLIERTRVEEGVWFTAKTQADIAGRQVVMNRHVRMVEEYSDFKKAKETAGLR